MHICLSSQNFKKTHATSRGWWTNSIPIMHIDFDLFGLIVVSNLVRCSSCITQRFGSDCLYLSISHPFAWIFPSEAQLGFWSSLIAIWGPFRTFGACSSLPDLGYRLPALQGDPEISNQLAKWHHVWDSWTVPSILPENFISLPISSRLYRLLLLIL